MFPLNEKLKLYLTSVLENNIISVLSGLKDIRHFNNKSFTNSVEICLILITKFAKLIQF
jgi:hypothetical protein